MTTKSESRVFIVDDREVEVTKSHLNAIAVQCEDLVEKIEELIEVHKLDNPDREAMLIELYNQRVKGTGLNPDGTT